MIVRSAKSEVVAYVMRYSNEEREAGFQCKV